MKVINDLWGYKTTLKEIEENDDQNYKMQAMAGTKEYNSSSL